MMAYSSEIAYNSLIQDWLRSNRPVHALTCGHSSISATLALLNGSIFIRLVIFGLLEYIRVHGQILPEYRICGKAGLCIMPATRRHSGNREWRRTTVLNGTWYYYPTVRKMSRPTVFRWKLCPEKEKREERNQNKHIQTNTYKLRDLTMNAQRTQSVRRVQY